MKAKFIKAVEEKDIVSVRLFLANELMLDPRGESFREMLSYAEERIENLYEQNEEREYSQDENQWTQEFLFRLKNDLDSNFSKEKLIFYEKVAKVTLRSKAENLQKEESKEREQNHHKDVSSNQKVYAGVTVGGAIIAVGGLCLAQTVLAKVALVSLGVAGMAAGCYCLYNTTKK